MAILQEYPTLQVSIVCDGLALPEFDNDEHEMPGAVTKYIEAKSTAEFAVQFDLYKPYPVHAMSIQLSIDGKLVRSRIIGNHQYKRRTASVARTFDEVVSKIADGQCTIQKFCFSELEIDDSDSCALERSTPKDLRSMGVITLRAYYIYNLREVPMKERTVDRKRYDMGPISEKMLKGKALTHRTGLGTAVNMAYETSPTHTIFDYVDPYSMPFATFHFKYRSRAALQSLLIIPRSPSPDPRQATNSNVLKMDEFPESHDREGMAEDMKQQLGVKREHGAIGSDDEVVFVSATKRIRYMNGVELIDLT